MKKDRPDEKPEEDSVLNSSHDNSSLGTSAEAQHLNGEIRQEDDSAEVELISESTTVVLEPERSTTDGEETKEENDAMKNALVSDCSTTVLLQERSTTSNAVEPGPAGKKQTNTYPWTSQPKATNGNIGEDRSCSVADQSVPIEENKITDGVPEVMALDGATHENVMEADDAEVDVAEDMALESDTLCLLPSAGTKEDLIEICV